MFDAFLTDAVAADLRVLAIPGNHDSAERIAYAQGLLEKQGCACLRSTRAKLSGWNLRMSTGQWSSGCCRF